VWCSFKRARRTCEPIILVIQNMIGDAPALVKMSPTSPRRSPSLEYHPDSPKPEAKTTAEVATQTDQKSDYTYLCKESNQRMEIIANFSKSYGTLTQLYSGLSRNLVQQQHEADQRRLKSKEREDQTRRPKEEEVAPRYYDKYTAQQPRDNRNASWKPSHSYYQPLTHEHQPRRRYSPHPTDVHRTRAHHPYHPSREYKGESMYHYYKSSKR